MIEDIQKVNKMAKELLQQGIAIDREDAVKKAQEMLNKNIENRKEGEVLQSVDSLGKVEVQKDDNYYKNLIEKTKEQMERQLSVFTEKMNEMIKEINDIKEQLKTRGSAKSASEMNINAEKPIKEATEEPASKETSPGGSEAAPTEDETAPKPEKQEKLKKDEPHPKRGEFSSDDVAIDKVFYFGNK